MKTTNNPDLRTACCRGGQLSAACRKLNMQGVSTSLPAIHPANRIAMLETAESRLPLQLVQKVFSPRNLMMNSLQLHCSRLFRNLKRLSLLFLIALVSGGWGVAHAAGGGENLLLVVNPNDEPSLRIANAYVAARHIPICNILYLSPPASPGGFTTIDISEAQFDSSYLAPIYNAIAARGLMNQIDYIGTLGQSQVVGQVCINNCLAQLTQLHNGMTVGSLTYRESELCQDPTFLNTNIFTYTPGTNTAIHHTQLLPSLSGTAPNVQWYISGMIGYTGQYGMSPGQVIQSLLRSVAGDGAKPAGTIYFENNSDIRSSTRAPYWPSVQNYMTAHGISWIQQGNSSAPVNCRNVLGAEIGASGYGAPNGSNYVPGAWADCLTSNGGEYDQFWQTQAVMMLQGGCAGSAGTIAEPLAQQSRFPLCDIWVFQHDGSTLGEAFYKSVYYPDMIMFQGDLLSQAFADIPQVTLSSAPANNSTVIGIVSITGSASLSNPLTATGIASLTLFVDGTNSGMSVTGNSGTFNLNTTTLTDGLHELRVVAYNDSQAASEGCALLNVVVNNLGQSVSVTGTSRYTIGWNQSLAIPVTAVQGSGPTVTGIQLQCNGRVIGSISGNSGSVQISGTQIAYDANPITPVALLSNGGQVQGAPISVTRVLRQFHGTRLTPRSSQNPGFDFYYYPGAAGNTLATTNFSGTAAYVGHSEAACIRPTDANDPNIPSQYRGTNNAGLAVQIKGSFSVMTPGEYGFSGGFGGWTSGAIVVDGVPFISYDLWNGSSYGTIAPWDTGFTVYLLPGEHTVTIQLVQATAVANGFSLYYRGLQPGVPGRSKVAVTSYYGPYETASYGISPTFYTVRKTIGQ